MSFFYLTPVKGDLPVHFLEKIVTNRLLYLEDLLKGENVIYNEFVVEGSIYDNVGHYMLCVTAILNKSWDFVQFILKAEMELFRRRILSISAYDMRSFAKKVIRCIKKHDKIPSFMEPLLVISRHLMLKDLAQHICSSSHSIECTSHCIQLNFRHCLQFIAKRQVELRNGIVYLPCGKWKQYLILLFSMNVRHRIMNTNLEPLKGDPRVKDLLLKFKTHLEKDSDCNSNKLCSKDVDKVLKFFPPCMYNLHSSLRKKHRLSHSQRFYYTLFLKDIGMPVEEAVDFWKREYSLSPNGSHTCCHNWDKDEKKYVYGIRHMYGLEGGRKSYSSVSCQHIQSADVSCNEGGCPFKGFDIDKLVKVLKLDHKEPFLSQINELRNKNQYTSACVTYLKYSHNVACDNSLNFNFTPVKFYMKCFEKSSVN
ncbi:DNA primase large subunit-like [Galleria mellonella]|uniref:DNA primase large subunit-like n=1 Tax=Galleria mellonella TaxID=7137 RepID=A0A6J1WE18_GALME|nr:DNA primase large subunit-like [Galleria mellonella]